jgi:phage gpG-like protein
MADLNKVKVIDRGWNKLQKQTLTLKEGKATTVGFQGSEAEIIDPEHGGLTNVELGAIHEFGTVDGRIPERHEFGTVDGRIPERPMIRRTFDENKAKYEKDLIKAVGRFYDTLGSGLEGSLLLIGEDFKADVIQKVRGAEFKDWADSTKAMKLLQGRQGDVPLWMSGQLMNSLTAIVTDNPNEKRQS